MKSRRKCIPAAFLCSAAGTRAGGEGKRRVVPAMVLGAFPHQSEKFTEKVAAIGLTVSFGFHARANQIAWIKKVNTFLTVSVQVERNVKHESETNWKQLGSLANGVLRSVDEKRKKQAAFLAGERSASRSPIAGGKDQLDLPLFHDGLRSIGSSANRYSA